MLQENEKVVAKDRNHLLCIIREEMIKCMRESNSYECDLNFIDVSNVTDMSELFSKEEQVDNKSRPTYRYQFNGTISKWDVSNVTNMKKMFAGSDFNGDISSWKIDISKTDTDGMLESCEIKIQYRPALLPVIASDNNIKILVQRAIDVQGLEADLNFIDVSNVTNMEGLFAGSKFNGNISEWDVSNVTNMNRIFADSDFNGDISKWEIDTEKVNIKDVCIDRIPSSHWPKFKTIIANNDNLKELVKKFLDQIGNSANLNFIDVSNVTNMEELFAGSKFNGNISEWDVSNVTNMESMFEGVHCANLLWQEWVDFDISKWNISKVTNMKSMFAHSDFNGDTSNWEIDIGKTNTEDMLKSCRIESQHRPTLLKVSANDDNIKILVQRALGAQGYNADLNFIDVSNVTNMEDLFADSKFNGIISEWDVSNVTNMNSIFANSLFEGDISEWKIDTEKVNIDDTCIYRIPFSHRPKFKPITADNGNLKGLVKKFLDQIGNSADLNFIDVSNVSDMDGLFANTKFNGDISEWDVSNVTNMKKMFANSKFNGDISEWDVSNVINMESMFEGIHNAERQWQDEQDVEGWIDGNISEWKVSNVTNMKRMFADSEFNGNISNWEIDINKTATEGMFDSCEIKIQYRPTLSPVIASDDNIKVLVQRAISVQGNKTDLNFIDVSKVTNMESLFEGERIVEGRWQKDNWGEEELVNDEVKENPFNGDVSKWDISNVTNMKRMFADSVFNGDISSWKIDISKTATEGMLESCWINFSYKPTLSPVIASDDNIKALVQRAIGVQGYHANLNFIDISNVKDINLIELLLDLSNDYEIFYGDISSWKISNADILNTDHFPKEAKFKYDISSWKFKTIVANNSNLKDYVNKAIYILGSKADLNFIDVSNVTNMEGLFAGTKWEKNPFNGDISRWNVSNVTNMESLFEESDFNNDISNWDVSSVVNMASLFKKSQFNGDISKWNVSNVTNMSEMFKNSSFDGNITKWKVHKTSNVSDMFTNSPKEKNNCIPRWFFEAAKK